jgi:hypothetical protein
MPMYEFENRNTGERREVFAHMRSAPPFSVTFDAAGEWQPAEGNEPDAWHRVLGNLATNMVEYGVIPLPGQLPVSRTLPVRTDKGEVCKIGSHVVQKYKDGTLADMRGRRIIRNRRDAEIAAAQTGYVRS